MIRSLCLNRTLSLGANFECKRNAAKANIKGAFRAFLATNYQNLNEIVRYNAAQKHPVVNLRVSWMKSSLGTQIRHGHPLETSSLSQLT